MISTRWGRARTFAVAGAAAATGLVLAVGAGPAGAAAPRTVHSVATTYSCSATVLGSAHTFTSSITLSGTVPASVAAPGDKVSMTGFQSKVTIPASLVSTAETYGVTWVSAGGFVWYIRATDAKVAPVNAGSGLSIPQTTLPKPAANVTVTVPKTAKTVGPWTSSAKGTMVFTDGILKFTLNDNLGLSVPISCTPKPAVTLGKTTVK
jgi:hypothetical protein